MRLADVEKMRCFPQDVCMHHTLQRASPLVFIRAIHTRVFSQHTGVCTSLMFPTFKARSPNRSRHGPPHKICILGYLTEGILHEGHNHKKSWKCIKSHLVASSRAHRWCATLCCKASIPQTYQKLQPIGVSCVTPC